MRAQLCIDNLGTAAATHTPPRTCDHSSLNNTVPLYNPLSFTIL